MTQFNIVWKGSPNFWQGRENEKVKAIVFHGTGSPQTPLRDDLGDVDSTFASLGGPSTHFAIGRDGSIHQYVETSSTAWGNGVFDDIGPDPNVAWLMECWKTNQNPNYNSISIETKNDNSNSLPLTEIQYQALLWLTKKLLAENPQIPLDRNSGLLGHYQIQRKGRARCPGPVFPWSRLMQDLSQTPQPPAPNQFDSINLLTGQPERLTINEPFFSFWQAHGGIAQLGLPVTPEVAASRFNLGFAGSVQIFERARAEWHDSTQSIMWGRVGAEWLELFLAPKNS